MPESAYTEPVATLIALGDNFDDQWRDYIALGLTADHIPDLIRMVLDEDLWWAYSESDEVWASVHAWRALGQLRAVAAVEPLLTLFHYADDEMNDWVSEDLPEVLGMIGPAAIPALRNYMADTAHGWWARSAAAASLVEIVKRFPETRAEVVAIHSAQLARFAEQDEEFNAGLVADLVTALHGVEAASIIQQAYAADKVDMLMLGDWEDAQIELGRIKGRMTPRTDSFVMEIPELAEDRPWADFFPDPPAPPIYHSKPKPGRNDPCWCGSGKKYKQCHLREDNE